MWYVNSKKIDTGAELNPDSIRITNVADNKFTVSWTTEVSTDGYVMYGKVGEKLASIGRDERDSLGDENGSYVTHYVTVTDLQPNMAYAFRIATNKGKNIYDNNGSPYSVTTAPTIATTPSADAIYGQVQQSSTLPADGAIVYVNMPGAAPASTLVKSSGAYTIPVSTLRTTDLTSYIKYDSQATVVTITVDQGKQQATADVGMTNAAPVPLITMGKSHDFRTPVVVATESEQPPVVAELAQESASPSATAAPIFNVEPLGSVGETTLVTITNPAKDGETISTSTPELMGKGPKATVLSLVVSSTAKTYKDTVAIASDGTWDWAPTTALADGNYTLSLAYIDSSGKETSVKRTFIISSKLTTQPAFVSTPSASIKASPVASPSPSIRAAMPATTSGVPVTGVIENTVLTAILGAVIMITGALLLAL
jgi:hypothetical protein